ncbi:MAG: molybdenum cofactor biosynthesis protein MoaE [Oscillospiraceae bacterium]|nr:molybdenum cofactor biosynthesis protein MoaE [Oscillospiraceae bacterium]
MGNKKTPPSMDQWIQEAKHDPDGQQVGMFLVHNGVVRETPKAKVRGGEQTDRQVTGMHFSYDEEKVADALSEVRKMPGIYYARAWLNSGDLDVGDDIMYVLVGGDIRPHVIDALQSLVGKIKGECVTETEVLSP